jgi:hypothetical protein
VGRDDAGQLRDQTIEVTETVEEPVVSKQARVREEVVVGKKSSQRTETVRDTVRKTEVDVEPLAGDAGTPTEDYEENSPAYRYGRDLVDDGRFRGRNWQSSEPDIRADFERRYPGSKWEEAKAGVRRGWEAVPGRR